MLQVVNVKKKYVTGDFEQIALNGVSLNLRDNEFVAILGPSGSGKTTLLNIIGGLDRYDSGDLIINGVSTRRYKDRDWDSYRNHTVGFVFQSYNLIPHQTVLSNVELALTIGGISRKERRKRALDALSQVGLREQAHKRPNQMSGGQMQRVAIARALVNNPRILLADEPTGALDTNTSIQVMELLKEVANDRLVVMVTHNPELAEDYANRIVRVKDGNIIGDTNPYILDEAEGVHRNLGHAKMSLLTAFSLSLNNLLTKKGRTILTAFAGSIGIIGISLILSLSQGFQNYVDKIQEDTMTSYPLQITSETANIFGALLNMKSETKELEGELVEQQLIASMMNSVGSNDLKSFKTYLETHAEEYDEWVKKIDYSYSVSPLIYTLDVSGAYAQLNPNTAMSSIYSDGAMSMLSSFSSSSSMGTFVEADMESVKEDTELLRGRYPEKYDEVMVVLSQEGVISDLMLYSLGLRKNSEMKTLITDVMSGQESNIKNEPMILTYDDIMNVDLRLIDPTELYQYNAKYGTYEDMTGDREFLKKVYDKSLKLKITGVAYTVSDESTLAGVIYTRPLVEHVIESARSSEIVRKQMTDRDVDVFSGNRFDEKSEKGGLDFNDMVTIDEDALKDAFKVNIDTNNIGVDENAMKDIITATSNAAASDFDSILKQLVQGYTTAYSTFGTYAIEGYKQMGTVTVTTADNCDEYVSVDDHTKGCKVESIEQKPDVSAAVAAIEQMKTAASDPEQYKEAAASGIDEGIGRIAAASTMDEAEAAIDALVQDPQQAALLKSMVQQTEDGVDTSAVTAALQAQKDTMVNAAAAAMAAQTSQMLENLETALNDAPDKQHADEIIDQLAVQMQLPAIVSAGIKNQIKAQYILPEGYEQHNGIIVKQNQYTDEDYLTLEYLDTYRQMALSDEMINEMTSQVKQISLNRNTAGKVVRESFSNYYDNLETEDNRIPVSKLPSSQQAVNKAVLNNEGAIFEEAYSQAKEYMALLVMKGTAEAVSEVMKPIMEIFGGSEELMSVDTDKFAKAFNFDMDEDELTRLMTSMLTGSSASYSNNLLSLGYQDMNDPSSISIYFKDFDSKELFMEWLDSYNEKVEEQKKIQYTDITGILMKSVETIINSVTYVLIAFVSISLIVSSIMIGIITYISVLERTKEIGILRAIGASKHNISSIFNAETFIIGLLAGLIGVGSTYLLNIPINHVIHGINENITAVLNPEYAAALVVISVILTLIGGIIPSKSASRKDPVIALRSE